MKIIEDLTVKVTYMIGYGDIEMPQEVYDQIVKAMDSGRSINMSDHRYPEAADWLKSNMTERDSMEWEAEIEEID